MPGDLVLCYRFPTSGVSHASDLACLTEFCVFRWVQSPATSGFSSGGGGGSRQTSPSLSNRNGDGGSGTRSASFVQIPSQRSPASSGFSLKPSTAGGVASPSPPPFVHSQQQQPSSNRMVRSTGSMPSAPLQRNTPSPTVQYPSGSAGIIPHDI
jgi:hypothetical protein